MWISLVIMEARQRKYSEGINHLPLLLLVLFLACMVPKRPMTLDLRAPYQEKSPSR